jgi:hypothetical protein
MRSTLASPHWPTKSVNSDALFDIEQASGKATVETDNKLQDKQLYVCQILVLNTELQAWEWITRAEAESLSIIFLDLSEKIRKLIWCARVC